MTPQDQRREEPQGYFQETLFGEPEWIAPKKKRNRCSSSSQAKPEAAPEPQPKTWALRAFGRVILSVLWWIGEQAIRFRGLAYAVGIVIVLTMTVLGLSYWEAKVWGYHFRIEKLGGAKTQKEPPASGIEWGPIIIEKVAPRKVK